MRRQRSHSSCKYRNALSITMNIVYFREKQSFRQQWWYVILILLTTVPAMIFSIYALVMQTVYRTPIGTNPAPNAILILTILLLLAVLIGSLIMELEVWIDQLGIHYRFFPLIPKARLISIQEIQEFSVRKYKPIAEYGGWGVRRSFRWGKAYNVSGNIGIQLYLTNGKKVLFGTHRQQAFLHALDKITAEKTQNN